MANEFKIKKGLIVTGASGGTVVDIQGSQGQLFSVTDDLSGSIFAVSDISGVPILDVNSSGEVNIDGTLIGSSTAYFSGAITTNLSSEGTYFTGGSGAIRQLSITSGTNTSAHALHTFNIASSNGKYEFDVNGTTELSLDSSNAIFAGSLDVNGTGNNTFTGNILIDNAAPVMQANSSNNASGFRINVTGVADSTNNLFRVQRSGTTMIDTRGNGNTTFTAQAFSAATSSGDGSSTLTTKGYVDSLITGATIYRGAWDPSGGGYGSPDLSGVTQTSGYYYICSAAGTAEPNGTGTEPDTWAVGDWVIYNDISGTGQWQKIDNSSVLSGVGTGQTVALWEGAGSVTDSETLGNAPITVSGNDTTFAGDISIPVAKKLSFGGGNHTYISEDIDDRLRFFVGGAEFMRFTEDTANLTSFFQPSAFSSTVSAPTFLGDLNGTINTATTGTTQTAGNNSTLIATTAYADAAAAAVPIGNYLPLSAGSSYPLTGDLFIEGVSTPKITITDTTNNLEGRISVANNYMYIEADNSDAVVSTRIVLKTDGVEALYLDGNQNAIFPNGNVGIGTTSPDALLQVGGTTDSNGSFGSFNVAGSYGVDSWARAYIVSNTNILPILQANNTALQNGGAYRVTGHIDGTGTDQSSRAVFWNQNGTWFCNVTGQSGASSNSISFLVDATTGLPSVKTYHANDYTVRVWHERINLNEGIGTDNSRHYFGADAYMTQIGNDISMFTTTYSGNNTTGKLGIGIVNPSEKLHVVGNARVTGAYYDSNNSAGTSGQILSSTATGTDWINGTDLPIDSRYVAITGDTMTGELFITNAPGVNVSGAAVDQYFFQGKRTGNSGNTFSVYDNNSTAYINSYQTMSFRANQHGGSGGHFTFTGGNVGIGTTSPTEQLHVYNTGHAKVEIEGGANEDASLMLTETGSTGFRFNYDGGDNKLFIGSGTAGTFNTKLTIERDSGNVGIGTTTPNAKLDIQGTQGQLFSVTDDLSGSIFAVSDISGVPIFDVNSSGTSYFDGNVGIGAIPSSGTKLEVNGQTVINSTNVATGLAWFNNQTEIFSFEDNSGGGRLLLSDTTVKVAISANSNSYFNGGNVGIGTTSPGKKLDVAGDWILGGITGGQFENYGYGSQLDISELTSGGWARANRIATSDSDAYVFSGVLGNDTTLTRAYWTIGSSSDATGYTYSNGIILLKNGNVGIGTTSPGANLDVAGAAPVIRITNTTDPLGNGTVGSFEFFTNDSSTGATRTVSSIVCDNQAGSAVPGGELVFKTSLGGSGSPIATEKMRIDMDGNVGIGTTSPDVRLEVVEASPTNGIVADFVNSTNAGGTIAAIKLSNADSDVCDVILGANRVGTNFGSDFFISPSDGIDGTNRERFRITEAGNVGIGTTSPNAKLNVDGGIKIEGTNSLSFGGTASIPAWGINSSGNDLIINDQATTVGDVLFTNAGNVGIGHTSPTGKLDIFRTSLTYAINRANTLDRAGLVIKSSGNFDSKITFSSGANSVQYIQALNNAATTGRDININPYGGNVITAGTMTATNFILSSDERLKENIEKACDNRIKADWKTFELKTDKGQKRYGVIAQELEKTNPEFVREDTQGFKSVAYIDLLIAKIAELEARLEKLEK